MKSIVKNKKIATLISLLIMLKTYVHEICNDDFSFEPPQGLCSLMDALNFTNKEKKLVRKEIKKHAVKVKGTEYYWPSGESEPREKWLKKRIKANIKLMYKTLD